MNTENKIRQLKKRLDKQEERLLDQQENLMESLSCYVCSYYKRAGEKEIVDRQGTHFEDLDPSRRKELKQEFRSLCSDGDAIKRQLVDFGDLWWVKDEYRTQTEDYELQVPRACSFESTTPCIPSYKFERALKFVMSRVYSLLHNFHFKVPEFNEHWKDHHHRKKEKVFDIEVNLDGKMAENITKMKSEVEKYDALHQELKDLNSQLDKEGRKKLWESL